MGRRANGEGSIYKLANGRWRVSVSVRLPSGKLHRTSKVLRTRADAVATLAELRSADADGTTIELSRMTVAQYLARWIENTVKANCAANTVASYTTAVTKHITPRIGHVRLGKLSPMHIEEFLRSMERDGVGGRARQAAYQVLMSAMQHAVHPLGLIRVNPLTGIKRPRHSRKKIDPFEANEVRQILDATADGHWHALFVVAFTTGMRIGELFGLHWLDVDLNGRTLTVAQQALDVGGRSSIARPKTKASIRTIELPNLAYNALLDHRAILLREGLGSCRLVFPNRSGGIQTRANFYHGTWVPLLKRLKLRHRGMHHSRHTFATLTLSAGVPLPVVAATLGHNDSSVTQRTYSHALPSQKSMASEAIDRLIG